LIGDGVEDRVEGGIHHRWCDRRVHSPISDEVSQRGEAFRDGYGRKYADATLVKRWKWSPEIVGECSQHLEVDPYERILEADRADPGVERSGAVDKDGPRFDVGTTPVASPRGAGHLRDQDLVFGNSGAAEYGKLDSARHHGHTVVAPASNKVGTNAHPGPHDIELDPGKRRRVGLDVVGYHDS
jgi:hypothetical protein